MKVGDLVNVRQQYGCHTPPQYRERGLGVVLDVIETERVDIGSATNIYLGDSVVVALTTGKVDVFNQESVEVVNERR